MNNYLVDCEIAIENVQYRYTEFAAIRYFTSAKNRLQAINNSITFCNHINISDVSQCNVNNFYSNGEFTYCTRCIGINSIRKIKKEA